MIINYEAVKNLSLSAMIVYLCSLAHGARADSHAGLVYLIRMFFVSLYTGLSNKSGYYHLYAIVLSLCIVRAEKMMRSGTSWYNGATKL